MCVAHAPIIYLLLTEAGVVLVFFSRVLLQRETKNDEATHVAAKGDIKMDDLPSPCCTSFHKHLNGKQKKKK